VDLVRNGQTSGARLVRSCVSQDAGYGAFACRWIAAMHAARPAETHIVTGIGH
jgi:hypothetical protein